jgi:hypothetical protein
MTPENVGQQFKDHVTIYRGLHGVEDFTHDVAKNLGNHWSTDPDVARDFASNNTAIYDWHQDHEENGRPGLIVKAQVHPKHIVDPYSKEGDWWHMETGVLPPGENEEAEHTVREGSPVRITGVTKVFPKFNENNELEHVDEEDVKDFPKVGFSSKPQPYNKAYKKRFKTKGVFYQRAIK